MGDWTEDVRWRWAWNVKVHCWRTACLGLSPCRSFLKSALTVRDQSVLKVAISSAGGDDLKLRMGDQRVKSNP